MNRFYTVPSPRAVRRATGPATLFAYVVALGSFLAGLAARHIGSPPARPIDALPALTSAVLGDTGLSLLAAAVLAASMSTADSVALTAASALVYDAAGHKSPGVVRAASASIVVAASLATVLLLTLPRTIYAAVTAVFKAGWTLTAGAFLIPLLAALGGHRDPGASRAAALTGPLVAAVLASLKVAAALTGGPLPHPMPVLVEASFTTTATASTAAYILYKALRAPPRSRLGAS